MCDFHSFSPDRLPFQCSGEIGRKRLPFYSPSFYILVLRYCSCGRGGRSLSFMPSGGHVLSGGCFTTEVAGILQQSAAEPILGMGLRLVGALQSPLENCTSTRPPLHFTPPTVGCRSALLARSIDRRHEANGLPSLMLCSSSSLKPLFAACGRSIQMALSIPFPVRRRKIEDEERDPDEDLSLSLSHQEIF